MHHPAVTTRAARARTRRAVGVVAAAGVAALALSGCSAIESGEGAQPSASSSTSSGPLASRVLTVLDLPPAWVVQKSAQTTSQIGCVAAVDRAVVAGSPSSRVSFDLAGHQPTVVEKVGSFGSTAASAYAAMARDLAGCGAVAFRSGSYRYRGTVSRFAIPAYGTQSTAYLVRLHSPQSSTFEASAAVALVRTGKYVAEIEYLVVGSLSPSVVAPVVQKAAAKLD